MIKSNIGRQLTTRNSVRVVTGVVGPLKMSGVITARVMNTGRTIMITRNNEQVGIGCAGIHTCRHNSYGTKRARESGIGKLEGGGKRISTF